MLSATMRREDVCDNAFDRVLRWLSYIAVVTTVW